MTALTTVVMATAPFAAPLITSLLAYQNRSAQIPRRAPCMIPTLKPLANAAFLAVFIVPWSALWYADMAFDSPTKE